mgnify:FL=1
MKSLLDCIELAKYRAVLQKRPWYVYLAKNIFITTPATLNVIEAFYPNCEFVCEIIL